MLADGRGRQGRRQLAEQRSISAASTRPASRSPTVRSAPPANNAIVADGRRRHHLRQDRQGSARHRLDRRRRSPTAIVEARGMKQVTDTGAIETAIEAVIAANPDKVEEVKAKPKLAAWFVGQVMKQTGGKANPAAVNAAPQDATQFARRGVIRTKCANRGSAPHFSRFFVRTRNDAFNPYKMGVSCNSPILRPFSKATAELHFKMQVIHIVDVLGGDVSRSDPDKR